MALFLHLYRMKKFILFAVFGVLFAPLSFAHEEDQTLEFHPSAWKQPFNKMMPMRPEMPNFSGDEEEDMAPPATSGGISLSESDMASLKRQMEEIDQKLQALRAEKEAIMQKMKSVRSLWRDAKKEMKKEFREKKKWMQEEDSSGAPAMEGEAMPFMEMPPMMENRPMEMKIPRMGFTPFQWKKDNKEELSTMPEFRVKPKPKFQIEPNMLQQSIIRPSLSADQKESRYRQADAKKRMMKLREVSK